jgi:hypothetical protein
MPELALEIVQLTKEHMWGPKKIAAVLARLLLDRLPSPRVPFDLCTCVSQDAGGSWWVEAPSPR